MCERISELRQAVCAYAGAFDPALVSGTDALAVMAEAATIERIAAVVKALAATRVNETAAWKGSGESSTARFMARATGTSAAAAADAMRTAERLKELPVASAAARRGELSAEQASAIASAATANPAAEQKLVETATRASLQELREESARVRAAAENSDIEARYRRTHARRALRHWTDPEGMFHLHFNNTIVAGADLMAAIDAKTEEIFVRARAEGRREPLEAYRADALCEIVAEWAAGGSLPGASTGAGASGHETDAPGSAARTASTANNGASTSAPRSSSAKPKGRATAAAVWKAILRVDHAAWVRGYVEGEEVCEIAGFGPIPVSVAREMIASGDPFLAAVVTKGVTVTGVAHLGRKPTAYQQTALEWRDPTCAADGCSATARLQNDHRDGWADTHITQVDSLDRLCPPMHQLKTRDGWSLVDGVGKRPFVPPSDPRHPRNAQAQERPPPEAAA
jgi:hypothetical protein